MSNASMKEQLQAVASQLSDSLNKSEKPSHKITKNRPKQSKPPASKPKWLDYAQYGVELLKAYFPGCFKSGNDAKPLKKGIKQDLVKRLSTMGEVTIEDKACMIKSLAYYVNTMAYHKSMVEGDARIDLDGQPSGIVSKEEAKYSLERNQTKLQAKQNKMSLQNQATFLHKE